jgi:hypothetical protein
MTAMVMGAMSAITNLAFGTFKKVVVMMFLVALLASILTGIVVTVGFAIVS